MSIELSFISNPAYDEWIYVNVAIAVKRKLWMGLVTNIPINKSSLEIATSKCPTYH